MLIAQVLDGGHWGELDERSLESGVGGRETAMIQLGHQWAKAGHHVRNFVLRPDKRVTEYESGGRVEWLPLPSAIHILGHIDHDALVSWEQGEVFDVPEIRNNVGVMAMGMQVAHPPIMPAQALDNVDYWVSLSNWAGTFLVRSANIDEQKVKVIPNGVDLSFYEDLVAASEPDKRHKNQFVHSSSPDRGLHHLIDIWPDIRRELPDATLHIGYGVKRWLEAVKWSHNFDADNARRISEGISQPGIVDRGLMGQRDLAALQMESSLCLYPCDTYWPTETGCITVVESMAAWTPVVTTDCDSLEEQYGDVSIISKLPFDEDHYVMEVIDLLSDEGRYATLQHEGRNFAESRAWEVTSQMWLNLLAGVVA